MKIHFLVEKHYFLVEKQFFSGKKQFFLVTKHLTNSSMLLLLCNMISRHSID